MIGHAQRYFPGQLDFLLLDQAVDELGNVQHFNIRFLTDLIVKNLERLVAVGTGRNQGLHAASLPGFDIPPGASSQFILESHLVTPPAATDFGLAQYSDIDARIRQNGQSAPDC